MTLVPSSSFSLSPTTIVVLSFVTAMNAAAVNASGEESATRAAVRTAIIVGVIIGFFGLVCILGVAFFIFVMYRRAKRRRREAMVAAFSDHASSDPHNLRTNGYEEDEMVVVSDENEDDVGAGRLSRRDDGNSNGRNGGRGPKRAADADDQHEVVSSDYSVEDEREMQHRSHQPFPSEASDGAHNRSELGDDAEDAAAAAHHDEEEEEVYQVDSAYDSRAPSPERVEGVTIENRVRQRHHLPRGTVVVHHDNLEIRINFSNLAQVPAADPPPPSREERKRLAEAAARVASPLVYGRAEYRPNDCRYVRYRSPSLRSAGRGSPLSPKKKGSGEAARGTPLHVVQHDAANTPPLTVEMIQSLVEMSQQWHNSAANNSGNGGTVFQYPESVRSMSFRNLGSVGRAASSNMLWNSAADQQGAQSVYGFSAGPASAAASVREFGNDSAAATPVKPLKPRPRKVSLIQGGGGKHNKSNRTGDRKSKRKNSKHRSDQLDRKASRYEFESTSEEGSDYDAPPPLRLRPNSVTGGDVAQEHAELGGKPRDSADGPGTPARHIAAGGGGLPPLVGGSSASASASVNTNINTNNNPSQSHDDHHNNSSGVSGASSFLEAVAADGNGVATARTTATSSPFSAGDYNSTPDPRTASPAS